MVTIGNVELALLLTTLAGLSTGIGSVIAYFIRNPKTIYLSFFLGLSAGVMIYVSFVELLYGAIDSVGHLYGATAFFLGVVLIMIIDLIVPEEQNPHHCIGVCKGEDVDTNLMKTGMLSAVAIAIHNFPEGLATFGTAINDFQLGVIIALALAIHNIPEGMSVSIPIFYATKNKNKAFKYSFLSGIAEPIGAVIGFLILMPFLSKAVLASLLAFVAGIMVYISIDKLLPAAQNFGNTRTVAFGVVLGMFIMAVSLLML
ncbi:MAG: zinc transporter ZupT [Archaeoglobaceae archaeon]